MDEREVKIESHVGETDPSKTAGPKESVGKGVTAPVGATAGAFAGGVVGTILLGPIGTALGAIVGAVGGGWEGLAEGARRQERPLYNDDDDAAYRRVYDSSYDGPSGEANFDSARPAYALGHIAAMNPDYRGRSFDEIEADLRHGWTDEMRAGYGEWSTARRHARAAYEGARQRSMGRVPPDRNLGGTVTHQRPSYSDPAPKYENPVSAAETVGPNAPGSDPNPAAGKPEWIERPVDQGGFGAHMEGGRTGERAEPWTEMDKP